MQLQDSGQHLCRLTSAEFALVIPVSGVDFLDSREFCLERTGPETTDSPSFDSSRASLAAAASAACSRYLGNK